MTKKFKTALKYLNDKWGDRDVLKHVQRRFKATDEFMAGWLTAHTSIDSNKIHFEKSINYTEQIAEDCKKFMGVK